MVDRAFELVGSVLFLAGAALPVFVLLARHRSRFMGRCVARRGSAVGSLLPWRFFRVRVCGYSLRGIGVDAGGLVTCPECGTRSDPTRPRVARGWRPWRVALACLVVGAGLAATPSVRHGTWPQRLPTLVVVAGERVLGDRLPWPIAREIPRRAWAGEIRGFSARWLAAGLVDDLRADTRRFNMHDALQQVLRRLPPETAPAFEPLLDSADWQQRQAAAMLLHAIVHPTQASDRLLEVTVEGLADDALPYDGENYSYVFNAATGTPYLARVGPRVSPWLRPGLEGGDEQQRLLCAISAGFAGCGDLADLAAPVLVEHLRDNTIDEDAKVCAPALYHLGPGASAYLLPHVDAADAQLRGLARAILDALGVEYAVARYPEGPTPRVTGLVRDPIREMTIERMEWGWLHGAGE